MSCSADFAHNSIQKTRQRSRKESKRFRHRCTDSLDVSVACNPTFRQTIVLDFLTLFYFCDLRFLLFKKNSEQEETEITENCISC